MSHEIDRRDLLKMSAAGGAAWLASQPAHAETVVGKPSSKLIVEENARPGTQQWMLAKTRIDPATKYRCPWIEGYTSHASIEAGETLQVMVSTNPASDFQIEFFRLGYYGGDGGRWLHTTEKLKGHVQPMPEVGERRLQNCQWSVSYELPIPADWPSGVYVGKLKEFNQGLERLLALVFYRS
ncbi:MAG: twin-arginine translocation signal domain-containing protein [Pirellulaceae bacterium]